MQLASHGGRGVGRWLNAQGHSGTRGIHISSFLPGVPRASTPGTANKLLSRTRTLLGRFITQLTTPGTIGRPSTPIARSFTASARARASIQNGLSFPVRTALSRPAHALFLPRPPPIPRCTTQVGLGAARSFSSARPIFQNLIENVPVAGRAFWEVDWEVKMREERARTIRKPSKHRSRQDGGKEMLKPKTEGMVQENISQATEQAVDTNMEYYFSAPPAAMVTTCLFVPLSPASIVSLPESTPSNPSFLPLPALGSIHASYGQHNLRVESLFARLDTANVWTQNVSCSAYGTAAGREDGLCTVLKLEFAGWSMAEVRGVIGESGTGWCVLAERRAGEDVGDDGVLEGMSSEVGAMKMDAKGMGEGVVDPAESLVLPTLDFSSASIDGTSSPPPSADWFPDSDFDDVLSDPGSDISSPSCMGDYPPIGSWQHCSPESVSPSSYWFGFSSDFASRGGGVADVRA